MHVVCMSTVALETVCMVNKMLTLATQSNKPGQSACLRTVLVSTFGSYSIL